MQQLVYLLSQDGSESSKSSKYSDPKQDDHHNEGNEVELEIPEDNRQQALTTTFLAKQLVISQDSRNNLRVTLDGQTVFRTFQWTDCH